MHRYYQAGCYTLTLIVRNDQGSVSIVKKTAVVEMLPLVITRLTSHVIDAPKGVVAFDATVEKNLSSTATPVLTSDDSTSSSPNQSLASQSLVTVPLDTSIDIPFYGGLATSNRVSSELSSDNPIISHLATYVWNFGDGSRSISGQKAIHKFTQNGTYYVSLIASSPSGATATKVHKVNLDGVIQVSPIKNNKEVLKDYPITFNSPYKDNLIFKTHSIHWDFGDGTVVENHVAPRHVYRKAGNYTVSLIITDKKGTSNTSQIPVEVVSAMPSILSLSVIVPSKIQDATEFTAIIDNPHNAALTYLWNFGDGSQKTYAKEASKKKSEGSNVRHMYDHDGTYTVTLEVTNETGNSTAESIVIAVNSVVQIESIAYQSIFKVGKASRFRATASSKRGRLIYQWLFERSDKDTSRKSKQPIGEDPQQRTGQAVSFTFLEAGFWSITLTVSNGSTIAVETFSVFVMESKLAIAMQVEPNVLVGQNVEFSGYINSSISSQLNLRTIEWDFGDGTTIESPVLDVSYQYRDRGNYTVMLSVTDTQGITATSYSTVSVAELPLLLVAGGRVLVKMAASEFHNVGGDSNRELVDRAKTGSLIQSINDFCFYSGETLQLEGKALVGVPDPFSEATRVDTVDAIAPTEEKTHEKQRWQENSYQRRSWSTTISSVQADDSVQYQQTKAISVEVPQHRDLVNNLLLQTSSAGYSPNQLNTKVYGDQMQSTLGWSELFLAGDTVDHPTVYEIERGPLIIPGGVSLENMVIVVNRGDILLQEDYYTIENLVLVARDGRVELDDISATAVKIFASKPIQTTKRSQFKGNSILASEQHIVFNGSTVDADDCLKIISQRGVHFDASGVTQSQILAKGDIELGQGTTLQGNIRTLGNVIFNDRATLRAATRLPMVESYKTLTFATLDLAIDLNIQLPKGVNDDHHTIYVVDIPSDSDGTIQLANGGILYPGKQLTCDELKQMSFYPTSAAAETTSCFVYAIEDRWGNLANQTLSLRFEAADTSASRPQLITALPPALWPPMGQMVEVRIRGFERNEADVTFTLESITCSEPIGAKGTGGSDYDYEIIEDDQIFLRAVQSKSEADRVYTLLYRIEDNLGDVARSTIDIPVALSADICVIEA